MAGEEKTEQPTARRRRDAIRKGQIAQSADVPQAAGLLAVVLVGRVVAPAAIDTIFDTWERSADAAASGDSVLALRAATTGLRQGIVALVPLVAAVGFAGLAGRILIGGLHVSREKLKPKASNLSFKQGIKRIVSKRSFSEAGRTFLKLIITAALSWYIIVRVVERMARPLGLDDAIAVALDGLLQLLIGLVVMSVVLAAVDGVVARRRYTKELRMTRTEVREEHKQSEGNPTIKGEIRRRQRAMSRMRMIAEVGGADVVVTNPTHLAVALRYRADDHAPVVVAKGAGVIAQRIREEAERHGVPIREDVGLARTLYKTVEIGDAIPVELYMVVAELLAEIYRTRPRSRASRPVAGRR
ncbi:MAG: EscU/YscU/HrcU family type III secretion system export apparatus switch protein [Actinomycetota bacterium]|nr:EscU/YscU/HrcU family type III secretion system export apparatus switch protein [Actinomycetota bacterium]